MKKNSRPIQFHKNLSQLSPAETVAFLDDYAKMIQMKDEKTKLISLRVPKNVLNAFKVKAQSENKKYQSLIVQLMRDWSCR